jgi:hypothetical protein
LQSKLRASAVAFRHSVVYGPARGAPPAPCGRPCLPSERESHGGACVRVCSADRSVSRGSVSAAPLAAAISRRDCRGLYGRAPVNASCRPFVGTYRRLATPISDRRRERVVGQEISPLRRRAPKLRTGKNPFGPPLARAPVIIPVRKRAKDIYNGRDLTCCPMRRIIELLHCRLGSGSSHD